MSAYLNEVDKPQDHLVESQDSVEPNSYVPRDENYLLKRGIWLYFLLLIFEGALRKWGPLALASPLLVIRDPVAMWLIFSAWKNNLLPSSFYLSVMWIIGIISIYLAMFIGHGNLIVALYGARILIFHFPLIFIIGRVFDREDVLKIGKATLWISVPMAMLIAMQFHSPQTAWVNRGLKGDLGGGAGFGGQGDYFRPPGTFSFTLGVSLFFGWLAPFVFYFWLYPKRVNRTLLLAASAALVISIPFSISRALIFEVALTLIFTLIAVLRKPEHIGKVVASFIAAIVVLAFLSQTKFFTTATKALTDRFLSANKTEGGLKGVIGDRFLGGLATAVINSEDQPIFGLGIGMGTNVGSFLLTGTQKFLIAEGEWARIFGELGPIFGMLVILLRVGLSIKIAFASYGKMLLGDLLPWLLLSFGFVILAQGSWAQPTSLGFCIMIGGVILAALRTSELEPSDI